jgi:uncharacterized protein HemX
MTDASAPSTLATAADAGAASRFRYAPFLLLCGLLTASLLAGWLWYAQRPASPAIEPLPVVTSSVAVDPRIDQLLTRVGDLERVNSVQRQQVVALTERVRVLGEQLSLHGREHGDRRVDVRGQTALALADQWLSLAQARLELFADPVGALTALDAADRALQASAHPRVPSLRQTLSIERESLRVSPMLDSARVAGQLEVWQQALAGWPERATESAATLADSGSSALLSKLDRYFRVRPLTTDRMVHGLPAQAELIGAELGWARVLLARGERAALHVSLQRCVAAIEQAYDTEDSGVQAALNGLQELIQLSSSDGAPRLGVTLQELRALAGDQAPGLPGAAPQQEAQIGSSLRPEAEQTEETPVSPSEPAGAGLQFSPEQRSTPADARAEPDPEPDSDPDPDALPASADSAPEEL